MNGKFADVLSGLGDTEFERELPGHHAIFIHFHCYTFVKVMTKKDNIVIVIRNRTGTFHIESDCNVLFFTPLKSRRISSDRLLCMPFPLILPMEILLECWCLHH